MQGGKSLNGRNGKISLNKVQLSNALERRMRITFGNFVVQPTIGSKKKS